MLLMLFSTSSAQLPHTYSEPIAWLHCDPRNSPCWHPQPCTYTTAPVDSQFKASSGICIRWLFFLGRNFTLTMPDNIATFNLLCTRVVSNRGKRRGRKTQMCHVMSYNTERQEKIKIQNSSLSVSFAGEQQASHITHTHGEQWVGGTS